MRCWLPVVCVLSIHSRQSNSKSSLLNGHSLFLSSLSFSGLSFSGLSLSLSLCGLSVTHSYRSIYTPHSNWEQFSFQPMLHEAPPTQSHSFHPLTIHSFICLQNTFPFNWPFAHTTGTRYHTTTYRYMCIKMYSLHSTANVCLHTARIHGYILRNVLHVYLLYAFPT